MMKRVLVLAIVFSPCVAAAVDLTACGQTIPAAETGVLQTDLDCSGVGTHAVLLLRRATLDLNGHTLVGGPLSPTVKGAAAADGSGSSSFTIRGPGVIAGTAVDAFPFESGNACVLLQGGRALLTSQTGVIDIHGCERGIFAPGPGPNPRGSVEMDHVEIHHNFLDGTAVRNLSASQVSAHHHVRGSGLSAHRLIVEDVTATANNTGLAAERVVEGRDVTVEHNVGPDPNSAGGAGIYGGRVVRLTNALVRDNQNPGVTARRVALEDSTVTGNGTGPTHPMVDILAATRPVLSNTLCLHSEAYATTNPPPTSPNWGVCQDD
jgi:hypothetical protein